jgi:hypothetical protein
MWLTNEERQEQIISVQVKELIGKITEAQNELLKVVKSL